MNEILVKMIQRKTWGFLGKVPFCLNDVQGQWWLLTFGCCVMWYVGMHQVTSWNDSSCGSREGVSADALCASFGLLHLFIALINNIYWESYLIDSFLGFEYAVVDKIHEFPTLIDIAFEFIQFSIDLQCVPMFTWGKTHRDSQMSFGE